MTSKLHSLFLGTLGVILMSRVVGGSAAEPHEKVHHRLQIEVHKTVVQVNNVRFTYGDEFVNTTIPSARAIASFEDYSASMRVPDEFQISWETQDGKKHEAQVAVRSKIPGSIENKAIVFVIMQDHIQAYVGISTAYGQKRERFY